MGLFKKKGNPKVDRDGNPLRPVSVYFNDQQKSRLESLASERGMSQSGLLRHLAMKEWEKRK